MFLLFQSLVNDGKLDKANLHSNMFLLFPLAVAPSLYAQDLFTFQYVSIISICLFINIFQCFRFTFQYVSIIFGIIAIEKICEIHLHSNMFLLFLTGVSFHSGMGQIYIPICFYYFRTNQKIKHRTFFIYIPICFYYFNRYGKGLGCVQTIYIPICFYYFTWKNSY